MEYSMDQIRLIAKLCLAAERVLTQYEKVEKYKGGTYVNWELNPYTREYFDDLHENVQAIKKEFGW